MRIEKCWFCSSNIYPGKGVRFVRGDCTVFNFCISKCYKLFKLRRNPRKIKWTKISRMIRGKQIVDHPINEFEKRMDEPMIYSREKFAHAIAAIPQIINLKEKLDMLYKKEKILSFFTIGAITCAIYKPIYAKSDISVFVFLVKFLSEILEITAENGISYTLHQFVKIGYVVKA